VDRNIRSTGKYLILPHTSAVLVLLKFTSRLNYAYEERVFLSNRNSNHGCVPPGFLVSRQYPQYHIHTFSTTAITIQVRQVLQTTYRLGKGEKYLTEGRVQIFALCSSIWSPVEIRNPFLWLGVDSDPLSEPPAKEDLKTDKVSKVTNRNSQSPEELDVYPEFLPHRECAIEGAFIGNLGTFRLNSTFGHLTTRLIIPLKEGAKGIFVPPFGISHVNHKVMDKQLSYWI
jgi:hypothetical protein